MENHKKKNKKQQPIDTFNYNLFLIYSNIKSIIVCRLISNHDQHHLCLFVSVLKNVPAVINIKLKKLFTHRLRWLIDYFSINIFLLRFKMSYIWISKRILHIAADPAQLER